MNDGKRDERRRCLHGKPRDDRVRKAITRRKQLLAEGVPEESVAGVIALEQDLSEDSIRRYVRLWRENPRRYEK
jgi:hypothetical protein